jgi:hypothetical protein
MLTENKILKDIEYQESIEGKSAELELIKNLIKLNSANDFRALVTVKWYKPDPNDFSYYASKRFWYIKENFKQVIPDIVKYHQTLKSK